MHNIYINILYIKIFVPQYYATFVFYLLIMIYYWLRLNARLVSFQSPRRHFPLIPSALLLHTWTQSKDEGKQGGRTSRGICTSESLISTAAAPPSLTLLLVSSLNIFSLLSIATQFHCSPVLCNYGRHEMHLNAESGSRAPALLADPYGPSVPPSIIFIVQSFSHPIFFLRDFFFSYSQVQCHGVTSPLPIPHPTPFFFPQPSPSELTDTLFSLSSPFTSLRQSCRPGTMPTLSPAVGRTLPWTNNISEAVSMPRSPIVCCQRGVNTHVWTQWIVLLCLRHAARPFGCTLPPSSHSGSHFSALNPL